MVEKVMSIKNISDIVLSKGYSPTVFITGVTGQDGSLMIDYLLKNTNSWIIGGARRLSVENHANIKHLENEPRFQLVNFDLTDSHSIYKLMETAKPDYFINFAAQSFVASSWDFARQTWQVNSTGVLDCLEAIRKVKPDCRFYNAGSSEEFGNVTYSPQDEKHPLRPRSPYGASKAAARQLIKVYRESYSLYAVQGWLFNHEGVRRGEEFVTRKITKGVVRVVKELKNCNVALNTFKPIELGNVDAKRDWSDAEDMVDAVWRMLNQDIYNSEIASLIPPLAPPSSLPESYYTSGGYFEMMKRSVIPKLKDYVVSSDENHTIRELVGLAFKAAGVEDGYWSGTELVERFVIDRPPFQLALVTINPRFYRPAEIEVLCGNSSAVRKDLGWEPKTSFEQLVKKMVNNDLNLSN
jgi:GDPmannose 4,6-dehydratase